MGKRRYPAMRAIEACEQCRRKKMRCDESRPRCDSCISNQTVCTYKDFVPSNNLNPTARIFRSLDEIKSGAAVIHAMLNECHRMITTSTILQPSSKQATPRLQRREITRDGYDRAIFPPQFPTTYATMRQQSIHLCFPTFNPEYIRRGSDRPPLNLYDRASFFYQFIDISSSHVDSDRSHHLSKSILGNKYDSTLSIDSREANRLVRSYADCIQEVFPFIDLESVTRTIQTSLSPSRVQHRSTSNGAAPLYIYEAGDGQAWTQSLQDSGCTFPPSHLLEADLLDRTPETAIVMLVFALGSICGASEHLIAPLEHPDVWKGIFQHEIPSIQLPTASPLQPTLMRNVYRSSDRNIDKTPGLKYYVFAVRLLGEQLAGETLAHVQAFLLAGLYLNQLARVNESYSWIHHAGTIMQQLIKHDDITSNVHQRVTRCPTQKEREYQIRCYWTCYQLESVLPSSELLFQLEKPVSGILESEDKIAAKITAMGSQEDSVARNFTTMIQIFQILNRARSIYNTSYYSACPQMGPNDHRIYELNHCLDQLNQVSTIWNLGTHVATSQYRTVKDARVRYMINIVKCVLTTPYVFTSLAHSGKIDGTSILSTPKVLGRLSINQGTLEFIEAVTLAASAFDGMHGRHQRLILPDIFTTAHTLLGNLIIYGALRSSKGELWPTCWENWNRILNLTREIFQGIYNLSPILWMDYLLLERLGRC